MVVQTLYQRPPDWTTHHNQDTRTSGCQIYLLWHCCSWWRAPLWLGQLERSPDAYVLIYLSCFMMKKKSMKMAKILAFGSISPLAGLLNTFTPLTLLIQYKEGIDIDEKNLTGKNTATKTNILFWYICWMNIFAEYIWCRHGRSWFYQIGQFLGILAQSQQFLSAWSQLQNSKLEFCINTFLILLIKREEGQRPRCVENL